MNEKALEKLVEEWRTQSSGPGRSLTDGEAAIRSCADQLAAVLAGGEECSLPVGQQVEAPERGVQGYLQDIMTPRERVLVEAGRFAARENTCVCHAEGICGTCQLRRILRTYPPSEKEGEKS